MKKPIFRWIVVPIASLFLMISAVAAFQSRKIDEKALRNAGKESPEDWLMYGLDHQEQRYSLLKQIDTTNVGRLGLAWTYEIGPGGGNQEGTPLVHNGVLYSITNWSITYALDARTGAQLWRYDPMVNRAFAPKICCGVVNRGIGIYNDKIYVPVIDGRLVALNAATGKEVWSVQTTPPGEDYSVTMAPRIAKGKVIIGNAGAEFPVRGYITAYDAETSKMAWRFYTVPGDPRKGFENKAMEDAAKTWSGEWWKFGGGGTVWDGMAYDPESNLFYFGTGNGGPWPSELRQSRGKDNLYVASILAVEADSGKYKWHYQVVPEDSWDYDSVQQLTLADLRIGNQTRKVIMQANKNGFFYVLDRLTGKVISAEPYAQVNWASKIDLATGRPVVNPGAFYTTTQAATVMPGAGGAHNWAPMAFNPTTNLMYIPTSANSSGTYRVAEKYTYTAGQTNMGTNFGGGPPRGGPPAPAATGGIAEPGAAAGAGFAFPPAPPAPAANAAAALPVVGPQETGGWLVAIDPSTQKEKWRARGGGSIGGGALTTASNLVFQVTNTGHLIAYEADTGKQLVDLSTNQTTGMGPPITFMVDNKQYVAVAGGRGAVSGPGRGPGPAGPVGNAAVLPRVYVYTLDGKAVNPTPAPPAAPALPAGTPAFGGGN